MLIKNKIKMLMPLRDDNTSSRDISRETLIPYYV